MGESSLGTRKEMETAAAVMRATFPLAESPPLGCIMAWDIHPFAWTWDPGDMLLLYSDGVIETRRTGSGELFEVERLAAAGR